MKVEWEVEDSKTDLRIAKRVIREVPKICRILKIDKAPPIYFEKLHGCYGMFNHEPSHIKMDINSIKYNIYRNGKWKHWNWVLEHLKYWDPNPHTYIMAHELQHWKQHLSGKLIWNNGYKYTWNGEPLLYGYPGKYKGKKCSYRKLPIEVDAMRAANYVTKELHREKYLY